MTQLIEEPQANSNSLANVDNSPSWLLNMTGNQLTTLERLATFVSKSTFAKDINSMEKAITVMMQGMELGLQPMAAVRNIHIINGRPSLSADLMAALVIKHGHPRIQITELTEQKCSAKARRREETDWQEFTFTWQDAVKAQLATKDTWQKHPKSMLRARTLSGICHIVFPDLFAGVYVPEEMDGSIVDGDIQILDARSGEVLTTVVEPKIESVSNLPPEQSDDQPKLVSLTADEFKSWLKEMKVTVEEFSSTLSGNKAKTVKEWGTAYKDDNPEVAKTIKDWFRFGLHQYIQWLMKNRPEAGWLWDEKTQLPRQLEDVPFEETLGDL
jgi:hypothetical protein